MKLCTTLLALCLFSSMAIAQLEPLGTTLFSGDIVGSHDLSAVQKVGKFLAITSDESTVVQLLGRENASRYVAIRDIKLLPDDSSEIDAEALALDGTTLYVLGSHARARKRISETVSQPENRERLATIQRQTTREKLFRFNIDPETGKRSSDIKVASLRKLLSNHRVLARFTDIPGRENGIDFEGMAVADGKLYLGFRGPVLRGNYVPVLALRFKHIKKCGNDFEDHPKFCQTLYLNLAGRGIRSMHSVRGGFLVLSGPAGGGDSSFQLLFWDGRDCLPDEGTPGCRLDTLATVPQGNRGKPEGLAVLSGTELHWQVLIVHDGTDRGTPTLYQLARPEGTIKI